MNDDHKSNYVLYEISKCFGLDLLDFQLQVHHFLFLFVLKWLSLSSSGLENNNDLNYESGVKEPSKFSNDINDDSEVKEPPKVSNDLNESEVKEPSKLSNDLKESEVKKPPKLFTFSNVNSYGLTDIGQHNSLKSSGKLNSWNSWTGGK